MKPQPNEYAPYFDRYISLVSEDDVVGAMERQTGETAALLAGIGEEKAKFRYAPEKWSVKQVVGHVADAERVFAYRLLCIARGETQSLPGFDENDYMRGSNFDALPFAQIVEGLADTRRATLSLLRSLSDEAWSRRGVANDNPVSVRALAAMLLGHERHHVRVLKERYLTA
jgi:DinB superfamily